MLFRNQIIPFIFCFQVFNPIIYLQNENKDLLFDSTTNEFVIKNSKISFSFAKISSTYLNQDTNFFQYCTSNVRFNGFKLLKNSSSFKASFILMALYKTDIYNIIWTSTNYSKTIAEYNLLILKNILKCTNPLCVDCHLDSLKF
jgi:hypothetical protein